MAEREQILARWRQRVERGKPPTRAGTVRQVAKILHARHMKDVFPVKVDKTPQGLRVNWSRNEAELVRLKEHLFGRTLIFTDRKEWSNEQIVRAYRGQYQIEQAFHWRKAPPIARWWPMHHWTDQKIRVHAFYCVLALLLVSLLRRELVRAGYNGSIEKILRVPGGIREVESVGASAARSILLTSMKREAKNVFDLLNLARYQGI